MKTLQWLSIWGACLLWKFYETWMSPLEKWIKHIPHNLVCNSTGFQTHWWIPAHSGFPQCLSILTHLAGLFIFLLFCSFPFSYRLSPSKIWWVIAHSLIIPECQLVCGPIICIDLNPKWQKWELSFTRCLLWTDSVLSALHATPHTPCCHEVSEMISVYPLTQRKQKVLSIFQGYQRWWIHTYNLIQESQKNWLRMPDSLCVIRSGGHLPHSQFGLDRSWR